MFRRVPALPILTIVLLLLSLSGGLRAAEPTKPSDVFLQAFMILREVRMLEKAERYDEAAWKCREASEMFASIVQRWPAWQADMVDARRQKVRDQYRRLKQQAEAQRDAGEGGAGTTDLGGLPQYQEGGGGREVGRLPLRERPDGIATLPRSATPRQRFEQLQREVERLRNDRARLIRQMQDQVDNTAAANRNLGLEREKVAELQNQLAEAENELSRLEGTGLVAMKQQVDDLRAQLSLATEKLREQNEKTREVLEAYEASQETIAELTLLTEDLTRQRDEMAAIIKGLQTEEGALDLITENARLREQLNATQARVDDLEFDKIEDQEEIAALRQEVGLLREELAQVKAENEAYKQRMLQLQGSLEDTETELVADSLAGQDAMLLQENTLLRQIIQRQLKAQAFRQQKRERYLAEFQELESGSDDLIQKINELTEEVPLSEEEQAVVAASPTVSSTPEAVSDGASSSGEQAWERRVRRFAEAAAYNFGQERFEHAAAHYEDILKFVPQDVETLCNLGVTRIRLNQVEEARHLFDRAILANEGSGRAHFMHGVASFHLDDTEAAVRSLKRAMELEADHAEWASFLGVVHVVRGEWEQAVEALGLAVDLEPRQATAHYNLSYALLNGEQSDAKRALKHYQLALKHGLSPNERMENYFRKLQGLGDAEAALEAPAS